MSLRSVITAACCLIGFTCAAHAETDALSAQLGRISALARDHGISPKVGDPNQRLLTTYAQSFDPGARVFTQTELERFQEQRNGRASGFGFTFSSSGSLFAVAGYLEDAPAKEALPLGSLLTTVGTTSVERLSFGALTDLLRHTPAGTVPVTYRAPGGESNTVDAAAGDLQLPSIALAEDLPDDLAYIKLNGLYTGCSRDVVSTIRGWSETDRYGIVLDLRNAGGTDEEAVQGIASLLAEEGSFLFAFRDHNDQDLAIFKAHAGGPIRPPVMVLTDTNTTGAAELLAAVLAGSAKGAMLIGTPTAGDPLIRETRDLDAGLVLYLAVRKAVTENGVAYQFGETVTPHIRVSGPSGKITYEPNGFPGKATLDEEVNDRIIRDRVRNDPVLRRAVDLLLGLKALKIQRQEAP